MPTTDKKVLSHIGKSIREIDKIDSVNISKLDMFYIDTARELLNKTIRSNGYEISRKNHRVVKKKGLPAGKSSSLT